MAEKKFFVGVKGIIVKQEKVLLIKANKKLEGRDHWEVPGGRIDTNELIEEALIRELHEEVPNIKNIQKHEILHAHRIERDVKDDVSLVLVFFRVTADFDGEPQLSQEHTDYKWATYDEAMKLAYPAVAEAIKVAYSNIKLATAK